MTRTITHALRSSFLLPCSVLLVMVGLIITTESASAFSGQGTGINGDPFIITTCVQLQEVNNALGAYYELANDIDCSATTGWNSGQGFVPLGNDGGTRFTGSFDGNNHVISDIYINISTRGSDGTGLFGSNSGTISNFGLLGGSIQGSERLGTIVGINRGTINYVFSAASLIATSGFSGGFVGINNGGTISDSYSTGTVSDPSGQYVGGFAGFNNNLIQNSFATGSVTGGPTTGGFVGRLWGGTITNVFATGSITASGGGGLVGENNSGTITNAHWSSLVSGRENCFIDFNTTLPGDTGCTDQGTMSYFYDTANEPMVSFTNGASYLQENDGTTPTFTWHEMVPSDTTAPTVVSVAPTNGATSIAVNAPLVITFSEPMNTSTVIISSSPCGETCPVYTEEWSIGDTVLTLTIDGEFSSDTEYAIEIVTAEDVAGNPLSESYIWSFTTGAPYVLTAINPIPARVTGTTATYTFSVSGEGQAQYVAEMCGGNADGAFTNMAENPGYQVFTLFNLEPGITYECQFAVQSLFGYSNFLRAGPFTIDSAVSSGMGRSWQSGSGVISTTNTSTPLAGAVLSETCPVTQTLTQNLRAGARNGRYHPYTNAIVREVSILQAHMNRLGFNAGAVDGILGPKTDAAIKRMQTYLGTKADGFVGPKTRALINQSCGDTGLEKKY